MFIVNMEELVGLMIPLLATIPLSLFCCLMYAGDEDFFQEVPKNNHNVEPHKLD